MCRTNSFALAPVNALDSKSRAGLIRELLAADRVGLAEIGQVALVAIEIEGRRRVRVLSHFGSPCAGAPIESVFEVENKDGHCRVAVIHRVKDRKRY
jgi:hypothetical protein